MKRQKLLLALFPAILILVGATGSYAGSRTNRLLCARAVDAGAVSEREKNHWFSAIADAVIAFRLEPVKSIQLVPTDNISKLLPDYSQKKPAIDELSYFEAAKQLEADFILINKYEVKNRGKSVYYYMDLLSGKDRKSLFTAESNIPFDRIGPALDSCISALLIAIGGVGREETSHFKFPALGANFRYIKMLGEVILEDKYGKASKETLIPEYQKIIQKDSQNAMANYYYAISLFKTEQYETASVHIKNVLKIAPSDAQLNYMLLKSYRLSGKLNEAYTHSSSCDKMHLQNDTFLLEKAQILEAQGKDDLARKVYEEVLKLNPEEKTALLSMATHENDEGDFKSGLNYSEKLLSLSPKAPQALLEYARSLHGLGKTDKAEEVLRAAYKIEPMNTKTNILLGQIYREKKNYSLSVQHFTKAAELEPENLDYHLLVSDAMLDNGKTQEAYRYLKMIEGRFWENQKLTRTIGLLAVKAGDRASAVKFLENSIRQNPKDSVVQMNLAQAYAESGNFDKALESYKKVLTLVKDKIPAKIGIANCYLLKKDPKSAQEQLKPLIGRKSPRDVHRYMGDALAATGNNKEALYNYRRERDLYGKNTYVQEQIARLSYERGELTNAKREYELLAKNDTGNAQAFYFLAILSLREGNRGKAEGFLQKAEKIGKADAGIERMLGNAFSQNLLFSLAATHYQQSLALDSAQEEVLLKLSTSQLKDKKDSAAAESLVKLYNLQPKNNQDKLSRAGHIFNKHGYTSKAKAAYRQFIDNGFKDESVNISLSSICYGEKDYTSVSALLKEVDQSSPQFEDSLKLMMGHSLFQTGQHASALPYLISFLKSRPDNLFALELCAVSFEKTGDLQNAIDKLERFQNLSKEKDNEHAYHLATLYEKINNSEKAIRQYTLNIKMFPEDFRSMHNLAALYIKAAEWRKALEILNIAAGMPNCPPEIHLMTARTQMALKNKTSAAESYNRYLTHFEKDSLVWREYSTMLFNQKRFVQAVAPLQKTVQLFPGNQEILLMLGKSLTETGNYREAAKQLNALLTIQKNSVAALNLLTECYRSLNDTQNLKTALQSLCAVDNKEFQSRIELGSILIRENRITDASKVLKEANSINQNDESSHRLLALCYESQNNDELRLKHLKAAVTYSPRHWDNQFQLARYYLSKSMEKEALEPLIKTMELNPRHGIARFEYGKILLNRGNNVQALEVLGEAVALEPYNTIYLANHAYAAALNKDKELSKVQIESALKNAPEDPQVLYLAGLVEQQIGNKENAKNVLREALNRSPEDVRSLEAMGDIMLDELKFREAGKLYFTAWEKGGFNESRAFKLGLALSLDRKYEEAKDFFEAVAAKNPSHGEAMYRLTVCYCEMGDLRKAASTISRFQDKNISWKQAAQGRVYEVEGKMEPAWIAYTAAHMVDAENAQVNAGFGRLLLNRLSYDSAITCFTKAYQSDFREMQFLVGKAKCYEGMENFDDALELYETVLSRNPEHPDVHTYIAAIKTEQKDYRTAIMYLKKGLELRPSDPTLLFQLGQLYQATDQYESAIQAFKASIGRRGRRYKNIEALRMIGNIYYSKLINDKKAKEFYKKYVRAGGKSEEVDEIMKKLESKS